MHETVKLIYQWNENKKEGDERDAGDTWKRRERESVYFKYVWITL